MEKGHCVTLTLSALCLLQILSHNALASWDRLPDSVCPSGCLCMDKGSLVTCRQSSQTRVPPLLSTTIRLDLDNNRINILYNDSFNQAQYMQTVSLEGNGIIHIEAGSFVPLAQLRILRLGKNHLSYLPTNLFWNNRGLEELDLHGNSFVELPDNVMYPLHSLQLLNVSFNHLTTPLLGPGFQYTTQLSMMDLSGNNFVSLDAAVFAATSWWDEQVPHYLNLSQCHIRHVHPQALSQLYRLESLSLAGNGELPAEDLQLALLNLEVSNLQSLHLANMNISNITGMFTRFQHRHLYHLDLSHNALHTIPPRSFYYLVQLKELDLSFNQLSAIGDLSGLNHLEHLSLAHNHIREIVPADFDGLFTLRVLDLSHNALGSIQDEPFENFWDLHTLDLSSNQISEFVITAGLESLENLDLSDNLISNLDSIKRLLQLKVVDLSSNIITELPAGIFSRGHALLQVNFSRNIITQVHPQAFASSIQEVLDLSLNKISHLAHYGWRRLKELHLPGNLITNISHSSFAGLTTLTVLDLADNNLHELPEGVFNDIFNLRQLVLNYNPMGKYLTQPRAISMLNLLWKLERLELADVGLIELPLTLFANLSLLEELDLSGNRLTESTISVLQNLHRLNELNLADNLLHFPEPDLFKIPRLHRLDLSSNPFTCTCELMPFRNWLLSTNISITHLTESSRYLCNSPPEWQGMSLQEFHLQSDTCAIHERAVIIATVACSLLVLAMCGFIIVCRYKGWGARRKLHRTHYSAIDETSAVQINPHSQDNREWV